MSDGFKRTQVIKKIKDLVAKATSTQHAEEADACMGLVANLLTKYNLSMNDCTDENDDPITVSQYFVSSYDSWASNLLSVLSRYYGCRIVVHSWEGSTKREYTVAGRLSATETVKIMWPFVINQINKKATALRKRYDITRDKSRRQVANALVRRINTINVANTKIQEESKGPGLVPVDQINQALDDAFGDMDKMRHGRVSGSSRQATEAAANINFNVQAGHNQNETLLIGAN